MTITVHDAETGEQLTAREVRREIERRDGWVPDVPGWVHPVWDGMPAVAEDTDAMRLGWAATVVAYEHARHEQAQWADLAVWCAQTTATWIPTVTVSRPLGVTELPAWVTWCWQREHPWAVYTDPEPEPYQDTPPVQIDERLQDKWRQADDATQPRAPWWLRAARWLAGER